MLNRSEYSRTAACAPGTREYSQIIYATCLPRRNRSSILALLLLQTDFLFEVWVHDDLLQGGRNHRIKRTSKFGNLRHPIDCDVLRSSTESTISTSLIHSITSVGKLEQEHTSVLKFVCRRIREFVELHFRDLIPRLFNHAFLRISSFCKRGRIPS